MNKLTGTLLYVQIQKPVKAFVKPGDEPKPNEWKASIALTDEDEVDAYEEYAKSLDAAVSVKKVKAVEFPEKYKCDLPEGAGKNLWIITLRKSTELGKTGKPVPDKFQPRVLEKVGANGTLLDVTNMKLPANGSKGSISIDVFERANGTASFYLKNVLVTDMIEYEGVEDNYTAGDEFSDTPAPAPAKEAVKDPVEKPAPARKPKPKVEEPDDDSDLPF